MKRGTGGQASSAKNESSCNQRWGVGKRMSAGAVENGSFRKLLSSSARSYREERENRGRVLRRIDRILKLVAKGGLRSRAWVGGKKQNP